MTQPVLAYRWSRSEFVRASEAGPSTTGWNFNVTAKLYGQAGYPVHWVVTPEAIYEHTGPMSTGYRTRVESAPGSASRTPPWISPSMT
jgi:hypothetical protein